MSTTATSTAPVRSIARCADGEGTFAPLFFSDDDVDLARARAMCRRCGLRASCLEGALERGEAYGVWGGELLVDGEIVEIVPRRGRPPRVSWRELVIDEVPAPPHRVA